MKNKIVFPEEHWTNTVAFRDLVAVGVIAIEAYVLTEVFGLAKAIGEVSQKYGTWPVDKFITVPVIVALAFGFYSMCRWKELRDEIAEHKRTEEVLKERTFELQEAKNAAEDANRTKSEFLANISHELRTPLHSIISFSSFGIGKCATASSEKILDYFERIHQSGETLLALLNDLLDLAKLESGKMVFTFRPTDIDVLVTSMIDEFRSLASERNLTFRYEQSALNEKAVLDAEKIGQVLRNLLSNAVKFSPEGGQIDVKVYRKEDSAVVSVRDCGTGIPEDELEEVFDKFVQSNKTKNGAGGTGLGLAICKEILTAHKGSIWAENNPDGGANLLFEVPLSLCADVREEVFVGIEK